MLKKLIFTALLTGISAGATADVIEVAPNSAAKTKAELQAITQQHKMNTMAVAIIKDGAINWISHHGEQAPGVPASEQTLFDVGSITKTIAAQTVLRLVEDRKISLDEALYHHWIDPDIADDKRHEALTPRIVLTHSTGFPNWRFFTDNGKLAFFSDPGTKYGYSGEGFNYLAKFAEKKLNRPFEQLAHDYVFQPAGIKDISMSVRKEYFPRIAQARDEAGIFPGYYCRPGGWCAKEGRFSAAGNMVISIRDYSNFLIWMMNGGGLDDDLNQQLNNIAVEQEIIKGFDCSKIPEAHCPTSQGYGLGWNITNYDGGKIIGHGGSDWSLISLAYYYPDSRDGLAIFLNGPSILALDAMIDVLKLLDPTSPKLHEYQFRADRQKK